MITRFASLRLHPWRLTDRNPKADPLSSDRRRSIVIWVFSIGPSEYGLGTHRLAHKH